MAKARSVDELTAQVCESIVGLDDFVLASVGLEMPDAPNRLSFKGSRGRAVGYLDSLEIQTGAKDPRGRGPTGKAMRSGLPVAMIDCETDPDFEPWRNWAKRHGIRSSLSVPFRQCNGLHAAILIYSPRPGAFGDLEIRIFSELASDLALALSVLQIKDQLHTAEATAETRLQVYRAIIDTTSEGFLICDRIGTIIEVNPAYCRMCAYEREELLGQNISLINPKPSPDQIAENIGAAIRLGTHAFTTHHRRKDGTMFPVDVAMGSTGSMAGHAFAFLHDNSEKRETERRLLHFQRSSDELRREAQAAHRLLISLSEQTLRQIGRELHDDIGQVIAGTVMLASSLAKALAGSDPDNAARAAAMAGTLSEAAHKLRAISHGLYPLKLEASTLTSALEELGNSLRQSTEMVVLLDLEDPCPVFSSEKTLHVYRIVQEACSNASRHSGATELIIRSHTVRGKLIVGIDDNGVGFPGRKAENWGGIGIATMRARAAELGGTIRIARRESGGTRVELAIPLDGVSA